MKSLHELTVSDLERSLIWEFQGDGLAAKVWPADGFVDPNTRGYIARTEFILANGDRRYGYCSPQDPSGIDYIQPVIVVGTRYHIALFDEQRLTDTDPAVVTMALGLTIADVYPIRYRCMVAFEGTCCAGTIGAP